MLDPLAHDPVEALGLARSRSHEVRVSGTSLLVVQDKGGVDCDERHAEATEYTLLKGGIGRGIERGIGRHVG
jgi:hypothetical protein